MNEVQPASYVFEINSRSVCQTENQSQTKRSLIFITMSKPFESPFLKILFAIAPKQKIPTKIF